MTSQTNLIIKFFRPCFALASFKNSHVLISFLFIWGAISFNLSAQDNTSSQERVIVKFKPQTSFVGRMFTIERSKSILIKKHTVSNYHVLVKESNVSRSTTDWLEELRKDENIEWAELDYVYHSTAIPNDPDLDKQWGLNGAGADIDAKTAWDITQGSPEVVVAVIDGGVDWTHPDLVANIWQNTAEDLDGDGVLAYIDGRWQFDPDDMNGIDDDGNGYPDDFIGWDFANNDNNPYDDTYFGHGTHVAGVIGAEGNNAKGIAGVSWKSKIMPLKFLTNKSNGYVSDAVEALDYAVEMGARVSNNSWGGYNLSRALKDAMRRAGNDGHLVVAAAGNDGTNNDFSPLYPASYDLENIISVTASTREDKLADFSNFGANSVDIAAPGVDIYSTLPDGKYGNASGSSMAAPFVSGTVALLISQNQSLSEQDIIDAILANADQPESMIGRLTSSGRLNLGKVLSEEVDPDCKLKARFRLNDRVLCPESSVTLTLRDQSGNVASRKWFVNGEEISNSRVFSYTFKDNGIYAIKLWVSDGDCEKELTQFLTVIGKPEIELEDISICRASVLLETKVLAANYIWKDEKGQIVGNTSRVTVTESGEYSLTVIDGCGNNSQKSIQVELWGDCVWPGDVNTDGVVNHLDILSWGLAYGASGEKRSSVSAEYRAHTAPSDWGTSFPEDHLGRIVNHKHADCNGDGIVDMVDAEIIRENAEDECSSNNELPSAANISLSLASQQETLAWGSNFDFEIELSSQGNEMINDLYGFAFTLEYSLPFSQAPDFEFPDPWLGVMGEDLASIRFEDGGTRCSRIAFVRLDQESVDATGNRRVHGGTNVFVDDLDTYSLLNKEIELSIWISEAILIKGDGSMLTIDNFGAQNVEGIKILPQEFNQELLTNLYPNPTNGAFSIEIIAPKSSQNEILITDLYGKTVYAHNVDLTKGENVFDFSLPQVSAGVYILQVRDHKNTTVARNRLIVR